MQDWQGALKSSTNVEQVVKQLELHRFRNLEVDACFLQLLRAFFNKLFDIGKGVVEDQSLTDINDGYQVTIA